MPGDGGAGVYPAADRLLIGWVRPSQGSQFCAQLVDILEQVPAIYRDREKRSLVFATASIPQTNAFKFFGSHLDLVSTLAERHW
jgi:hypothetical protein